MPGGVSASLWDHQPGLLPVLLSPRAPLALGAAGQAGEVQARGLSTGLLREK